MQTHDDMSDHTRKEFMKQLRRRAERMVEAGNSQITGGKPDEPILAQWKHEGLWCRIMPDDEQGILRISVGGGGDTPVPLNYCTIRGDLGKCIALLERAIEALRNAP